MSTNAPLVLGRDAARALITPGDAIAAITAAWKDYGERREVLSSPSSMFMKGVGAAFKVKGAVLPGLGVAGFRLIGDRIGADGAELTGDYLWIADAASCAPLGIVEELALHRLRTAVTGVVAAQYLARKDSRTLAIIGAGAIADDIPEAMMQAMPMARIRIQSRRFETAQAFARRHAATAPVEAVETLEQALLGADIVMTITSAPRPFLGARHMAPGGTLIAMGGDWELEQGILAATDRFIIDDPDFACAVGSVAKWIKSASMTREAVLARMDADIGEIVAGRKPGRSRGEERILAVIQGMATGDLALGALALRRAREQGAGAPVCL